MSLGMAQTTFLESLFKPLHGAQRNTLTALVDAICRSGSGRTIDIAFSLALSAGILVESAMNRLYRCLRNSRIDWWKLTARQVELLTPPSQRAVIAVDWTEWHSGLRMLVAGMVSGRRSVPVAAEATTQRCERGSQNTFENQFLKQLDRALEEADRRAVLLFDRGFLRTSLLRLLLEDTHFDFVVRLAEKRRVWRGRRTLRLDRAGLFPGHVLDLGVVTFRGGRGSDVSLRVVGVWAHGQKEPWWVATSLLDETVEDVVRLYYARMRVEELFRDQKGSRYGLALEWTSFRKPEHIERMMRIVGFALVVGMAVGERASMQRPKLLMPCKRKGPRLSVVRIGMQLLKNTSLRAVELSQSLVRVCFPSAAASGFPWLWKPLPFKPTWEDGK